MKIVMEKNRTNREIREALRSVMPGTGNPA